MVSEIPLGSRTVRAGDAVRVLPSRKGRRDGFVGTFREAKLDDAGNLVHVEVIGGPIGRPVAFRALRPERIVAASAARAEARKR
jgi:hypothetical protein